MASLIKKEKPTLKKNLAELDKLTEGLNKKYGKTIMGRIANNEAIRDKLTIEFIPTPCRALNEVTGGGFPKGRCTLIAGEEDTGKTSLILETIAKNQKKDPNFVAAWLESEHSLKLEYIVDTFGIDPERFLFIEYDSKLGAEVMLDIVQSIISADVRLDIFCINSLKCLVPTKEVEASLSDALVAVQARMNARLTRKFTSLVSENDIAFIMVCHLSTDIGSMKRDPLIISGGHAIKYWSALTLDLRKPSMKPTGEVVSREEGMKISVTVRKNHCLPEQNAYKKVEYYVVFGEGIEQILSCLDDAIAAGIIEKKGNWLYWMKDGKQIEKFSGKAAFRTFMKDNPDKWEEFNSMLEGCGIKELTAEEIQEIKEKDELIDASVIYDEAENEIVSSIEKESA